MDRRQKGGSVTVAGLLLCIVLWYAGAGHANVATIDSVAFAPIVVATALGALGGFVVSRHERARVAAEAATFGACGAAPLAFALVCGSNVWLDRGAATEVEASIVAVQVPKKGPATLLVSMPSGYHSLPRDLGPSCRERARATIRVRAGALGKRWVEGVRCD